VVGADPARPAGEEDLFKPFMFEAADHSFSVNVSVYSVNRSAYRRLMEKTKAQRQGPYPA
jgi:hypothetical protein